MARRDTTVPAAPRIDMQTLISLVGDGAEHVHGSLSLAGKLEWTVRTAHRVAGGGFAAYAEFEEGKARVLVARGAAADDVAGIAEQHLDGLVRSIIAADGVRKQTEPHKLPAMHGDDGDHRPPGPDVEDGRSWLSQLSVAVLDAGGNMHGVLLLGHHQAGYFGELDERIVGALAAHLGVALDNLAAFTRLAELEAGQREAAHQLQNAVLPPTPSVVGAELGRYYLAAEDQAPTGGDLYDWVVLPDGDLHLVVVDVLGKGVAATKDALTITYTLRLLTLEGCPLEELVARADRLIAVQNPDLVATVLIGRFSSATGELRLAGGGHPPALLVRAGGQVSELDVPGVAIGWPGAGSFGVVTVALARSDTVILYTDGLVEATKDITVGLATLAKAAAETADYPAAQLARALVERALAGADRRDDTLALVLRRRMPPPSAPEHRLGPFEHRFSPSTAAVPLARHLLSDWLERQPVDRGEIDDLLLAASELCANAVRAASGGPGSVVLRSDTHDDAVVIEVEDDGPGFEWTASVDGEMPEPDIDQGRGLFLVSALTDDVTVERAEDHTIVRCTKRAVMSPRQ